MEFLLDHAPCGFVSFTDEGIIIETNQTLKKILDYPANDPLEGKHMESILTIGGKIFYHTHLFPLLKLHSRAEEIFISLKKKDHTAIPVLLNGERKQIKGKTENHCILIPVHQRSKYEEEILAGRKQAEQTLLKNESLETMSEQLKALALDLDKELNKSRDINTNLLQFSKIISHDFQELAHKILIFADYLEEEAKQNLSEKQAVAIGKVKKCALQLQKLFVLTEQFIQVESNSQTQPLRLNPIIEKVKNKISREKDFYDFIFHCGDLPEIEGYPNQLETLFGELFANAIDFREPSRKLSIKITGVVIHENAFRATDNRYRYIPFLKITFGDNGTGFENQYNDYVFGLLKQVEARNEKLGVGLSWVKKITDHHNGSIQLSSEPGKGTLIKILLPVKQVDQHSSI